MKINLTQKVSFDQLDFEIFTTSFQAICGNIVFPADEYITIHDQRNLLGIRPKREPDVFVLNHMDAYRLGESLFNKLYQSGGMKVCYLNERRNWMAALIGEGGNPIEMDHLSVINKQWHWLNELRKIGFRPSIGVINGLDYNDSLAFYLLVEPIDNHISKDSLPVLTLDSFKFNDAHQDKILKFSEEQERITCARSILHEKAIGSFEQSLIAFTSLYKQLSEWKTNPEELTALCLDLYNKNRNIESIEADNQLQKELQKFIRRAERFFVKEYKMSALIDFIIQFNEIDFNTPVLERNKIEQIFIKKKSYQKTERVLGNLNSSQTKFIKYAISQIGVYREISAVLFRQMQL